MANTITGYGAYLDTGATLINLDGMPVETANFVEAGGAAAGGVVRLEDDNGTRIVEVYLGAGDSKSVHLGGLHLGNIQWVKSGTGTVRVTLIKRSRM